MIALIALVGGIAFAGAVVLLVAAIRPGPVRPRTPRPTPVQLWARYTRRPADRAGRRRDLQLLGSLAAGMVIFAFTGWLIAIPLVPLAALLLPKLLGQAPATDAPLLEALDRWVRTLATTLPAGRDVIQAIRVSRASAPPLIAEEVGLLVDRLSRRWEARAALQRFADALDSPESDAVIASLMLATTRTEGIRDNLLSIADSVQERLRAVRAVENERAKPRQTARLVTIISALLIGTTAFLGGGYFAPYRTPTGQLIITVLALAYVGSLLLLYRMSVPRRRERILIIKDDLR